MTNREHEEIERAELEMEGLTPTDRYWIRILHARGRGPKTAIFIRETYTETRGNAAFLRQQSATGVFEGRGDD